MAQTKPLSPHSKKVLETLRKNAKPLSAYELLARLQRTGIKAPQTVYRALDSLMQSGLVHRIETLNAFIACRNNHDHNYAQFTVCRACGTVTEIHDHHLCDTIDAISRHLKFRIEREMLELMGVCESCANQATT